MMIETLRINKRGRDLLVQIKRRTGIENWNILCRWALCVSLAEKTPPREEGALGDAAVEIHWRTFGGEYAGVYLGLLRQRCRRDGFDDSDPAILSKVARLHVFRGIGYLAGDRKLQSIDSLLSKVA